ncbi:hypothetical protein [Terrabacter carboxydivorans]|uniref:IrrE N-terminal-like domain-containing protein n=1 Tax=Terrabacter carboxydivorans TaxID=619730 RepID=A0ABP5ZFV0_9MICO
MTSETTRLQAAAYDAELAAGLPLSELGRVTFGAGAEEAVVSPAQCATYLHAVQRTAWFAPAFPGHARPVVVIGGNGRSNADPDRGIVTIGVDDRATPRRCERACLHELAHVVTAELGPDGGLREAVTGPASTRGHHHAWRANFVFIVGLTLGRPAAKRLRAEFNEWGLVTR